MYCCYSDAFEQRRYSAELILGFVYLYETLKACVLVTDLVPVRIYFAIGVF